MSDDLDTVLKELRRANPGPPGAHPLAITTMNPPEHNTGVWAYPTETPGLVVHRQIMKRKFWVVTHEPSTYVFRHGFRRKQDAMAAAAEYGRAAPDLDFTRSYQDLVQGYYIEENGQIIHIRSLKERMEIWRPIFDKYDKISAALNGGRE